jgi:hypothetical protein
MNGEKMLIWREVIVAYFKVISKYSLGDTEEKHE